MTAGVPPATLKLFRDRSSFLTFPPSEVVLKMNTRWHCHRTVRISALTIIIGSLLAGSFTLAADGPVPADDILVTLKGHTDVINAIAFSPDGRQVLTGSFDTSLKLWDSATGKEIRTLAGQFGHQKLVLSAVFSPDGQSVASGSADGSAKVWDVPSTHPLRRLVHADGVNGVAISPDGKTLAGACKDGTIHLWNPADGKDLRTLRGHEGAVTSLSFHGNNQWLASAGRDGTVRVWNVHDGKPLGTIYAHRGPVAAVAFHPNGSWILSTGNDGALRVWQWPVTPRRKLPSAGGSATSLTTWADGDRLISASAKGMVEIRNGNGDVGRTLKEEGAFIRTVAGGDGLAMAGTEDGHVVFWNVDNGQVLGHALSADGPVTGLAVDPQRRALLSAGPDGVIRLWRVPQEAEKQPLRQPAAILTAVLAPDGRHLFTGGSDKLVRRWDLDVGRLERSYAGHEGPVTAIVIGPDGKFVTGSSDGTIRLWDPNNDKALAVTKADTGAVTSLMIVPASRQLLSASAAGTLKLWNMPAAPRPKEFALAWQVSNGKPVRQLLIEPAGNQVIAAGDDGKLTLRALKDGKSIAAVAAHDGPITGLALDVGHRQLVSAGADGTAKRWKLPSNPADAAKLKPTVVLKLAGPADSVAINSLGTRIAVGVTTARAGKPGAALVQVFDAENGRRLFSLDRQKEAIHAVAFRDRHLISASADGSVWLNEIAVERSWKAQPGGVTALLFLGSSMRALSGGADKTVKLWDANTGKLIRNYGPLGAPVSVLAVSRDSSHVAAAAGNTVTLWDSGNGHMERQLVHPDKVLALGFSGDRSRLVTGSADGFARVWDTHTGQELEAFHHQGPVRGVAFGYDNRVVISSGDEKTLALDMVANARTIPISTTPVPALAIASYGGHVLTGGKGRGVGLWNLNNGNRERTLGGPDDVPAAITVSRNYVLFAVAGTDKTIRLYFANDGRLLGTLATPGAVRELAISPDNQVLAAACDDGSVLTWNVAYNPGQQPTAEFGKLLQTYDHAAAATGVAYAQDGRTLYSSGLDKEIRAWKVPSPQPRNFQQGREVDAVAFNSKGTLLATGSHDGLVRIWDVTKGNIVRQIEAHNRPTQSSVYGVAWSPDDSLLVSGSLDTSLKLWNPKTGALMRTFPGYKAKTDEKGHREGVFGVAFSPDGKRIASCSSDRTIRVWNVADGKVLQELVNPKLRPVGFPPYTPAHPGWVFCVRYTPDGKRLVSVGNAPAGQGSIAFWDTATGKLLSARTLALGPIYSVAISPDGKRVALGCGSRRGSQEANGYVMRMPSDVYVSRP